MGREIKFRAFSVEDGMVSPDYIARNGIAWWESNSIPTCSKEVMQYTGLKDKNVVEIYEGDVVVWYVNSTHVTGEIYYADQAFDMRNHKMGYIGWDSNRGEIEVIGNIHENPELLQGN